MKAVSSKRSKNKASERYPYMNLSLTDIKGKGIFKEKWKDIPGFEGLYQISNYGRVKSMSRKTVMNTTHGGVYISRERIRRSRLDIKLNKTVQENLYTLMVSLYHDGLSYHYTVPRLVYYNFVERFDLMDKAIYISNKDGDGRNTHASNLVKSDISTIKLASYKNGRAVSHLTVLSKPVTQFDLEGKPVANYPSMYEAGKITGFRGRNIGEVLSGKVHMYKGFFWKEGIHNRRLNLKKIERTTVRETIHKGLAKRLHIRKIDPQNVPAFLNLSTKSMPSERWKNVPGYEGLYKVSNLGRVKTLQKVTYGRQQKWMPEQIQKITIDFRINAQGKEVPGSTFASMAKESKKKLVSVPRLVYFLFVKEFKIKDPAWRIYYKDGNTLNVHYTNLVLRRGAWSFINLKKSLKEE